MAFKALLMCEGAYTPVIGQVPSLLLQLCASLEDVEVVQDKLVWVIHVQHKSKGAQQMPLHAHQLLHQGGIFLQLMPARQPRIDALLIFSSEEYLESNTLMSQARQPPVFARMRAAMLKLGWPLLPTHGAGSFPMMQCRVQGEVAAWRGCISYLSIDVQALQAFPFTPAIHAVED